MRRHRRVLAVASTGAGKTVCFAIITKRAAAKGNRILIMAHRKNIVQQISETLDDFGVRHGRIQPHHTMTSDLVQVGMVQTVAARLDRIAAPAMLIFDECHHCEAATYKRIADFWLGVRILGVTATPQRGDGRGLGASFDTLVEAIPMAELIKLTHLAEYTYLAPPQRADLSAVSKDRGDYNLDEMASAMDKAVITGDAIAHYRQHLDGKPVIVFCATVAHAEHVAAQFREAGYRAACIHGKMKDDQQERLIASMEDGRLQVLVSCDVVSEGTDIKNVAGVILLRRTMVLGRWLQWVGRMMRPKADGSRGVVADHVGNCYQPGFGLPHAPRVWTLDAKPVKPAAMATRTCKGCFRVFAVEPGWEREPCEGEPDCVFTAREASERAAIEQREGQLEAVVDPWAWAGGINPYLASQDELRALIAKADSVERLKQIAKARGYHWRWVKHVLSGRGDPRRAAA